MCKLWVDAPWDTVVDARGVTVTYKSGEAVYVRHLTHADYRYGLETGIRALNAWEKAERTRANVVKLDQRAHG